MATTVLLPAPKFVSGRWYQPIQGAVSAGAALSQNSVRLVPFAITSETTISALATRITTLAAGGNISLAIYASDSTTGYPTGAPLASTGSIATDATGPVSANLGANATLPVGVYWMAVNADNGTVVCQTLSGSVPNAAYFVGSATLANITGASTGATFVLTIAQAYGAWPTLTGTALTEAASATYALVLFKVA